MQKTKIELQTALQTEALQYIGERSSIAVEIGTGGGKTLLGLKHMAQNFTDSISYCVAAPTKKIIETWKDEISLHDYDFLLSSITFTTYRSLKKQDYRHDWLYLDECHSLKENHAEWLDSYTLNGGKIIALTGTYPSGNHSEKARMCNQYCPKIFEYHVDEAIDNGMLNNYKIFVHMLNLNKTKRNVEKKGKNGHVWYTTERSDYEYWEKAIAGAQHPGKQQMLRILRMKAIQSYPTKMDYTKSILNKIQEKTLVFANTKKQADELCKHSCHSSNPNSDKNLQLFKEGKIYRLSCIDQLSEGANIQDLKVGIIMHSYSNERKARQKIGRFLRLSPEETAIIHILCFEDTIDLHWVKNALKSFNQSKIHIHKPK